MQGEKEKNKVAVNVNEKKQIVVDLDKKTNHEEAKTQPNFKNKTFGKYFNDWLNRRGSTEMLISIVLSEAIVAIVLGLSTKNVNSPLEDENITLLLIFLLLFSTLALVAAFFMSITREKRGEDKENYSRKLREAFDYAKSESKHSNDDSDEQDKNNTPVDAIGRMMLNLEDIKEFYSWSQKQAKTAFALAFTMCVLGFLLMVGATVITVINKMGVQIALIPAVGGVITEIVAGTALVVYRNSLEQLNHYHQALHEDERFLSSVNLVNMFSTEKEQDNMLKEIIRSEIRMNLIGAKQGTKRISLKKKKDK